MRRSSTSFGNCIGCSLYAGLDLEGLCKACTVRERELVEAVQRLLQCNPRITMQEIAEGLRLDINRLESWVRQGRIRCVTLRSRCPQCGRGLLNQFSCKLCGLNISAALREEALEEKRLIARILQEEMNAYRLHLEPERHQKRFERDRTRYARIDRTKNIKSGS